MGRISGATLLPLFLCCAYSNYYQEPYMFAYEGGSTTFRHSVRSSRFHYLLYKGNGNDSIFLKNSSDPPSNSEQVDSVRFFFTLWKTPCFELRNLSVHDSGDYRIEIWYKDTCQQKSFYGLTVCSSKMEVGKEDVDGVIEWTISKVNQSQGDILQIYRDSHVFCSGIERQTILDTNQTFEILPYDLKHTAHLLSNGTTIHISNMSGQGAGDCHHILLWKEGKCHLYSEREWNYVHSFVSVGSSMHMVKNGARVNLKAHPPVADPVHWYHEKNPSQEIGWRLPFNVTLEEEGTDMYVNMVNYSLVIPSATTQHGGIYCHYSQSHPQESFPSILYVCSERNATNVTFSAAGDTAVLKCDGLKVSEWYLQRDPLEQEALVVTKPRPGLYRIHQQLRARANVSLDDSLILYGLTPEDSGVYRCRGWNDSPAQKGLRVLCFDQSIHLIYENPFGVNSMFYRLYVSLMGFGLLVMGMVSLLISVGWRSRGGYTTQKTSKRSIA